jgi:hypothetical protein
VPLNLQRPSLYTNMKTHSLSFLGHPNIFLTLCFRTFVVRILPPGEPGNSVSIVSGYGLDDLAIGVRFPAGAKDFSPSLCVQTASGAHPAFCTMCTGGPFPGGKSAAGA